MDLTTVGLWLLIIIFIIILGYYIVILIGSAIIGWSNLRLKLHNNDVARREADLKLETKSQGLSYVMPSEKGMIPFPRHMLEDSSSFEWLKRQYEMLYGTGMHQGDVSVSSTSGTIGSKTSTPDFFTLWQNDSLPHEKFLLGYNVADNLPVEVTFNDLRSTLVGGQTDTGKSTLVRLILIQAIIQGARIAIIDPHANAGEDSLADSFYAVNNRMWIPVAKSLEERLNTIAVVRKELQDRLDGISKDKTPLVLVIDETGALLSDPNTSVPLEELLNKISNEARKVHVYAICIGQNFHSKNMPTTVRNNFVSILSTHSRKDVARVLSDNTEFAHLAEEISIGQCVWLKRGAIQVLNIPNVTARHVALILQSKPSFNTIDGDYEVVTKYEKATTEPLRNFSDKPLHPPLLDVKINNYKSSGKVVDSSGENYVDVVDIDDKKIREILRLLDLEKSGTEIICTVFGVENKGDAFQKASKEYRRYLREIARRVKNV